MAGMASPAIAIEMAVGGFRGLPRRPRPRERSTIQGLGRKTVSSRPKTVKTVKNGGRDVTALKKHPGMSFGDLAREAISAACTTPA